MIVESLRSLAVSIDKVSADPRNARLHSERSLNAIKRSLKIYGQRKPIVVNRNTGFIEAGNGLYFAAKGLGWMEIAAVFVDDDKDTAAAFGLIDNKSATLADWDVTNLRDILRELDSAAFDISSTGFSDDEIDELLNQTAPERTMSGPLSKGYVKGVAEIDPLKLAYRLESVCHCRSRNLAIDLFSGQGRLSFWYERLFQNVIRVDKESYDGIDFNMKAETSLREQLEGHMDFDLVDFDDEGCPGEELQLFFSMIAGRKREPFVLCLTDGMGLALKVRARVNLFAKYLQGADEMTKIQDDSPYRNFDRLIKRLIDELCYRHDFDNDVINWYRGADGNVVYAGFVIVPKTATGTSKQL